MRDFRALLADTRCWDAQTQAAYEAQGEPVDDCILQNREELIGLCEFIEEQKIRSFLEIGTWTGRLVSTLHRLFQFDTVAACDDAYCHRFGLSHHFSPGIQSFIGNSRSPDFLAWRRALGHIDLVFIDGDHTEPGLWADFTRESALPHRFLAFHDILGTNRHTVGVRRVWRELPGGQTVEICRPHREIGLDHSLMGIGIWAKKLGNR
jgi:hypothetical protein